MNFKNWFIIENTVSQLIKQNYKENYKKMFEPIKGKLVGTWLDNLSKDSLSSLVKWYSFNYFNYLQENNLESSPKTYMKFFYRDGQSMVNIHRDYLATQINDNGDFIGSLKSKFNDPNFKISDLDRRVDLWHFSLESKNRIPGAKGSVILDLSNPIEPKKLSLLNSEWDGWKWVDLEKEKCEIESKSMGHCGNSGYRGGDTILSLRDENNIPHLTFILNGGELGEMKGRNNNKPSKKYHPAILELLKHPIIKVVKGGGYKPQNNFSLDDLDEEILEELLELKPDLKFDVFEDLEKRMEEIRKEWNVKDWSFAHEHSTLEDSGGEPLISCSGGFGTFIKVKLLNNIPQYYSSNQDSSGWRLTKYRDLKKAIIDATQKMWTIEDLEIDQEKNGISIRGSIYQENYGAEEIDNFESFVMHLAQDVDPYEQEFKNVIQRVLVNLGYINPYYVKKATQQDGKINWSKQKFKNFEWDVNDPNAPIAPVSHEINVPIFKYLKLGIIKNKNKELYNLEGNFKEKLEKELESELFKISQETWNIESKQKRLFATSTGPALSEDMKIKPVLSVKITADRKNWNMPWDAEDNPVENFIVTMWTDVEISQVNTYEEAKKAERMLHFIDDNYENIKNRLINKFNILSRTV